MFRRQLPSRTARVILLAVAMLVATAPLAGQDFNGAAKLLVMTGRVSVLKDGVEWARSIGDVVQPSQVVVTGPDGYAKFQLADGSTFEVFQNTRTVFHQNPGSLGELLDLWIGRVKVYIEHRNGPNHQRVNTQTAVISVRGTVFDVVVEDEDGTTLVSVEDGVVGVRHALLGGRDLNLYPGDSIRVFKDQPLAKAADKGSVARVALRAAAQVVYDTLYRRTINGSGPSGGGASTGGGTSGGGAQGDKGKAPTGGGSAPPPPPPGGPH